MDEPEVPIEGRERLTSIFGYWPSFHDAEVVEFNLWRGDIDESAGRYIFPVLTAKLHLWELTSEVDVRGYYVARHQTLATLRFHEVRDVHMADFNHQNAIFELRLSSETSEEGSPPSIHVEFEPAFGIASRFRCSRVEVVDAVPWAGPTP